MEHLKMCGFKWVLTNHGIAEWAVCHAKKRIAWLGHPPVVSNMGMLGLYLLCFCLSVVSLSLQLSALSDLDPSWRRETETNYQLRNCNYSHYIKSWWTYKLNYTPSVWSEYRHPCLFLLVQDIFILTVRWPIYCWNIQCFQRNTIRIVKWNQYFRHQRIIIIAV